MSNASLNANKKPLVAIVAGSSSDKEIYEKAESVLKENNIPYELRVISAHREPDKLDAYLKSSEALIYIAVAGLSAALPGVIASKTNKPVIGVPVSAKLGGLGGLDALLSIVQMPPGVPVGCVGIDRGENAAHLAIRILKLLKNK